MKYLTNIVVMFGDIAEVPNIQQAFSIVHIRIVCKTRTMFVFAQTSGS